ncbi:hypothetical protein METBIDRAFT_37976, partial [Metschnikowia bicuspidata var. bicuspidata NRRL YB-4993]
MDPGSLGPPPQPPRAAAPALPGLFVSRPRPPPPASTYTKKTLLQSPVVVHVAPQFRVCVTKPPAGPAATGAGDERAQTHVFPDPDSFFGDDWSDDDALLGLANHAPAASPAAPPPRSETVEVLVKHTLVLVAGAEHALPAGVAAAAVVRGPDHAPAPDDSLVLVLCSGVQLVVRVWRVPRAWRPPHAAAAAAPPLATSHVFRPFVVQWWRLGATARAAPPAWTLAVHAQGQAVACGTAAAGVRIHTCQNTALGWQMLAHTNVPAGGAVLHTCFAAPRGAADSGAVVLLAVVRSRSRRLAVAVYSWRAGEPVGASLRRSTLPLPRAFPCPAMVVPLAACGGFLFVCPARLVVVTPSHVWSADHLFVECAYGGAFPTAHFVPPHGAGAADEVFVASAAGVVYSVVATADGTLTCRPVLRVAGAISSFALHHAAAGGGYVLTYAGDSAGARTLFLASLFAPDAADAYARTGRIPYSAATLLHAHRSWAPVVDVLVVPAAAPRSCAAASSHELWALAGLGGRCKLSRLRAGYMVRRELRTFDALRKAGGLALVLRAAAQSLVCSLPFESRVFRYVPEAGDAGEAELVEPTAAHFHRDEPTLACAAVPGSDVWFQFTERTVSATDLERSKTSRLTDSRIVFADSAAGRAVLAVRKDGRVTLEIVRLAPVRDWAAPGDLLLDESLFRVVASIPGDIPGDTPGDTPGAGQLSMLRCFETPASIVIARGSFLGVLSLLRFDLDTNECSPVCLLDLNALFRPSTTEGPAIPHDVALSTITSKLYVGTKLGRFFEFDLDQPLAPRLCQTLALGITPVKLVLSKNDPHLLFACMRNLWLFNFYALQKPARVSFDEKSERSVSLMVELPTDESQHLRFAFLREDGLVIGSVFCHERPLVRQLGIGEPAKKLLFLDTSNLFVILCKSKSQQARLKFADRKGFRILPSVEIDPKTGADRGDWIFAPSETPTCALVWHINRNERVSKKLIVGTSTEGNRGSLKILDISKVLLEGSRVPTVKVVELWSISRDKAISSIQQIGSTVFFSSGCCVYSTSYSLENKR